MMDEKNHDLPRGLEEAWREWSTTEPDIDEIQLKHNLLAKIPDRMPRIRSRLVLVAAAASLLAVLIGLENSRQPRQPVFSRAEIVHETGANVILVLREGREPIYVATEPPHDSVGE
jgi:hypothetical protein